MHNTCALVMNPKWIANSSSSAMDTPRKVYVTLTYRSWHQAVAYPNNNAPQLVPLSNWLDWLDYCICSFFPFFDILQKRLSLIFSFFLLLFQQYHNINKSYYISFGAHISWVWLTLSYLSTKKYWWIFLQCKIHSYQFQNAAKKEFIFQGNKSDHQY